MPKVSNARKRKQQRKPKQKQKQKQNVKQNVKVTVNASGGLGGSGGPTIPTVPQYTPQVVHHSVPAAFRDTRGEDVALQRLSEIPDKFNSHAQRSEQVAPTAPLPMEYNDSPVDATQQNQIVAMNPIVNPRPINNNVPLLTRALDVPLFIGNRNLFEPSTTEVQKIEVLKSKEDLQKQTAAAREARQTYRNKREDERRLMAAEEERSRTMLDQTPTVVARKVNTRKNKNKPQK
jgi:hypothetical protein